MPMALITNAHGHSCIRIWLAILTNLIKYVGLKLQGNQIVLSFKLRYMSSAEDVHKWTFNENKYKILVQMTETFEHCDQW